MDKLYVQTKCMKVVLLMIFTLSINGGMQSCSFDKAGLASNEHNEVRSVSVDSIETTFILHPVRWHMNGSDLIVYNPTMKPSIRVFDYQNNKVISEYNVIGGGPNEYSLPGFCNVNIDNQFVLYDERKNDFSYYSYGDSILKKEKEYQFPSLESPVLYSRCFEVEDGRFIGVSFSPRSTSCHLLDFDKQEVLSETAIFRSEDFIKRLPRGFFSYNKNILAIAIESRNTILLYELHENELVHRSTIGDSLQDEDSATLICYSDVVCADGYVFALSQKCTESDLYQKNSNLEVYDLNGKQLTLVDMGIPISLIAWDGVHKKIVGFNPMLEESKLFIYNMQELLAN